MTTTTTTIPCVPGPTFGKKLLIFFLVFLPVWTLSKVPLYLAFDAHGDTPYEKGGLAGSINVEFWVNGLDDGKKKYTSDVLFLVWNALKADGIEIPYPQRVIHIKGMPPEPEVA